MKIKAMKIDNEVVPRSKKSTKKNKFPTEDESFKLEVAAEIGLLEKVKKCGWDGLSAQESGRLGGIITKKKKGLDS